ncbi:MAG: carboxymuconolactone decarboxylase family protein [Marinibacterium sp.]
MGILRDNLNAFGIALDKVDDELAAACPFDKKTEELFRFALSIKGRSAPCVRKHFNGARAAGASDAEIGYAFALTMRESAGADECWTAGVLSELLSADDSGACG